MTGEKLARIRACHRCRYRITQHPDFAGPEGYSEFCTYPWFQAAGVVPDRRGWRELSDTFMEGPQENCPAGYWAGLEPVDLEAERSKMHRRRLDAQRTRFKPLVAERLRGRPQEHVDDVLETLCALGALEPEIAVEISDELEGKTSQI